MAAILIGKKKYVLIPEKDYQALPKKAALKSKPEKSFTVEQVVHTAKNSSGNVLEKSNCKTICSR